MEGYVGTSLLILTQEKNYFEVSFQLHALVALLAKKELPAANE
jgi:hypothetical protein